MGKNEFVRSIYSLATRESATGLGKGFCLSYINRFPSDHWVALQHRAYMLEDLSHMHCTAEEWKVFDSYARRVRDMFCGKNTLGISAYQQLVILRPTSVTFPRLKVLYITPGRGTLMFPSSLRSLALCELNGAIPSRWLPYIEPVLRQAAEDVPLLEKLEILRTYRLYPAGGLHPLPFRALQTVLFFPFWELRPGDFDNFSRLLSTAPVRFLTLRIPMFSTLFVKPEDKTPIFLNVEILDISADPQSAGDIVSRIGSPHLHTVIYYSSPGPSSGFSHFFSVLAQRPVPIRSLKITVTTIESSDATATAYVKRFLQILEPVVSAGLQRLTLDVTIKGTSSVRSSVWKRLDEGCWLTLEHFECKLRDAYTGESVVSVVQS
jgi:hypothetical protein